MVHQEASQRPLALAHAHNKNPSLSQALYMPRCAHSTLTLLALPRAGAANARAVAGLAASATVGRARLEVSLTAGAAGVAVAPAW